MHDDDVDEDDEDDGDESWCRATGPWGQNGENENVKKLYTIRPEPKCCQGRSKNDKTKRIEQKNRDIEAVW